MLFISHLVCDILLSQPKETKRNTKFYLSSSRKAPMCANNFDVFYTMHKISVQWEIWSTLSTSGIRRKKRTNLSKEWMTTIWTVMTVRKLYVRQLWFSLYIYTPRHTHTHLFSNRTEKSLFYFGGLQLSLHQLWRMIMSISPRRYCNTFPLFIFRVNTFLWIQFEVPLAFLPLMAIIYFIPVLLN